MTPNGQHIAPDALQLSPDTPAWARVAFAGLSRQLADVTDRLASATDELETLRRLLDGRLVNRKECAKIAGVVTRTIQRYEDRGLISRTTEKGPALYLYTDAVKLRKMVK